MKQLIPVYKPLGETPLDAINEYKKNNSQYNDKKIGYAGRLDPMAHGLLLLMVEPETKKRSIYQNLDKVYEFETIWGISSDSHDILGIPQFKESPSLASLKQNLPTAIKKYQGTFSQSYPIYSAKTVEGKPLYWWAKRNRLAEISIPQKQVEVFNIEIMKMREIKRSQLSKEIEHRINSVNGDFRQNEILDKWRFILPKVTILPLIRLKVHCGSGMYVRSLVDSLGRSMDSGAITFEILRTRVGEYTLNHCYNSPSLARDIFSALS